MVYYRIFFAFYLYSVELVSAMQQCELAIITHMSPPLWASLLSLDPTPPGHHKVHDWDPCVIQHLTSHPLYT